MAQSTKSKRNNKPNKPRPDFPLFPHATGRWAKKIRGKFHYFGPWGDPDAALKKYLDQKVYLDAGRVPPVLTDGLSVRELCNRFLTGKRHLLDTNEITERTFRDYYSTCERIIEAFGRTRMVDDLAVDDFQKLRSSLAKTRGAVALGNEIQRVRMVFKYGYDSALMDKPIRYGQSFNKPSKSVLRKHRNGKRAKNGKRMFESYELRKMLAAAKQPLRAMILLGINCGFGQSDLASLPISALNLDEGWVDYPRPKTGVERRCPLWNETVRAVSEAIPNRPKPKDDADFGLLFLTKYGHRWVRTNPNGKGTPDDAVGKEFTKLLQELKLKRPGVSFYALRHTFETIGGESLDQVAVDHIMGHAREDMASNYREQISDERLVAVTDTIYRWLYPQERDSQ